MAEFRKAIELDPKNAEPHNRLGFVLNGLGRHYEAMSELRKAVELNPKSATPHIGLSVVFNDLGRRDEATAEYRRAVERDPKLATAKLPRDGHRSARRVLVQKSYN